MFYDAVACRFAARGSVALDMSLPADAPRNIAEMSQCEAAYQVVSIWLWLSMRFAEAFPDRHVVEVCAHVDRTLAMNACGSCRVHVGTFVREDVPVLGIGNAICLSACQRVRNACCTTTEPHSLDLKNDTDLVKAQEGECYLAQLCAGASVGGLCRQQHPERITILTLLHC